ncbi:MAG: tRNA preQ1(34) S-adenosylmethionine ribosyltransferase-isomerase QueA [Gammaproteobacteria bacterium]
MQRSDFSYNLPNHLIAQHPADERSSSRMLCLDGVTGVLEDRKFPEVMDLIRPGDLLVLNDTRVIPARLFGFKETGGKVEIMVERILDGGKILAQLRASKSPGPGAMIKIGDCVDFEIEGRSDDMFILINKSDRPTMEVLEQHGHMPLPPYIQRGDDKRDRDRYQTVYAREPGAVAAPTAGLHFTGELLQRLQDMGAELAYVTLHVGAGTFQPVRTENIEAHKMHKESMQVSDQVCRKIADTRERGGRIVAVGTTSVRCLESAAASGELMPFFGETDIFIYPGFNFRVVDVLITNFHLPESTLLMLVCTFAGYENVLHAYAHAIALEYRFFSYGDAMFMTRKLDNGEIA